MAEQFSRSVEDGLRLSKRLYLGKDTRAVTAPKPLPPMEKSGTVYLPTSPMVYAVISDPGIVDNPDLPSYQPHVHGRCDPPALIPLQMNRVELQVDSYLDTAFVRLNGLWRVHCVKGSKSCDCRLAIPMGEEGSVLGVEVEIPRKTYSTKLIGLEYDKEIERDVHPETDCYLKPHIFIFTIPKVDGGTILSIKVSWMQKVVCCGREFSLIVPFSFPDYVTPHVKKLAKKEKIQVNVNCGPGTGVVCKTISHPLKELKREVGELGLFYEAQVLAWTSKDLSVSYTISSSQISGGVLWQSPDAMDDDQRQLFCMYLFPGDQNSRKVFRKEIVFVIDISGSMEGTPLEGTKNALSMALANLHPEDSFNVIAFNAETSLFSSSMELATQENVDRAVQWMNMNFITGDGTNILLPLTQAIEMVSSTCDSLPIIFLVTDGTVQDERHICEVMKNHLSAGGPIHPRVYTFGIGSYCNHHFLRMLAIIGRGQYDAALDIGDVEARMQRLFSRAMSPLLVDLTLDTLSNLHDVEVYPFHIPDLSFESPLIISGRYHGEFPDSIRVKGSLGDSGSFSVDLTVHKAKEFPLDRVFAKQHINIFTARSWLSENKQLEEKVSKLSIRTGVASEYTRMELYENEEANLAAVSTTEQKLAQKGDIQKLAGIPSQKRLSRWNLCMGFGNLAATAENLKPGAEQVKLPEAAEIFIKAASNCCSRMCSQCCCMCFIQCCSKMNNQCAIVLAQICTALACFGCLECCSELCCGDDGQ